MKHLIVSAIAAVTLLIACEAHTRPQGIERHRDTVLIVLESTKSLRLCFHGFADVGQPSADLPHFRVGAVSQQFFV